MELLLDEQEMMDLGKNLQGLKITCREGCCWVTQSGDSRDHVLQAGSSFQTKNSGRLIVTATRVCRIRLIPTKKNSFHFLKKIFRPELSAPHFT